MQKTALIAGGTGLVGGHLIDYLINNDGYSEIKVLVRKGSSYRNDDVTVLEIEYDQISDFKKQLKADSVFCCLGSTMKKAGSKAQFYQVDFNYPLDLAKIVKENGCEQFSIVTASGANAKSLFFYNRVKGEVEEAIAKLDFKNLNIFQPSLLLGERNEQRTGEQIGSIIAKVVHPFLIGRLKKFRAIQAKVVAKALIKTSLENLDGPQVFASDNIQTIGQD